MAVSPRLAQLVRLAVDTFAKLGTGSIGAEEIQPLRSLASTVSKHDVGFDERSVFRPENFTSRRAPIKYIRLMDEDTFSMGIFVLRDSASLPLHDHPGMYGIIRAIHGIVGVESYTRTSRPEDGGGRATPSRRAFVTDDAFEVIPHPVLHLHCVEHQAALLEPHAANFHRVFAVAGPAAFLDILAPPYDLHGVRPCHYYERVDNGSSTFLKEIEEPPDYWTEALPYCGPPPLPCVSSDV